MNNTTSIQTAGRWAGFSRNRIISLAILAVIFVVLALLPVMMPESYWVTRISEYMRYAILTVGWVLFSGPTGYMSLATAAFYGLGFYMAAILNGPLPFAVVIILAGIVAFVVAAAIGALTLRLRGVYFCIFTFAVVLLLNRSCSRWSAWSPARAAASWRQEIRPRGLLRHAHRLRR